MAFNNKVCRGNRPQTFLFATKCFCLYCRGVQTGLLIILQGRSDLMLRYVHMYISLGLCAHLFGTRTYDSIILHNHYIISNTMYNFG